MENSDSDYFESADEEIYSDDECKISNKTAKKALTEIEHNLNKLDLDVKIQEETTIHNKIDPLNLESLNICGNRKENDILATLSGHNTIENSCKKSVDIEKQCLKSGDAQSDITTEMTKSILHQDNNRNLTGNTENVKHEMPNEILESKSENDLSGDYYITKEINALENGNIIKISSDIPTNDITSNTKANLFKEGEINWTNTRINNQSNQLEGVAQSADSPVSDMNMWDNDEWEPMFEDNEMTPEKCDQRKSNSDNWGGWGKWGVSSIITTATQSVSSLTNQVSQGLNTVMETSMGIPKPEELARHHATEENLNKSNLNKITETTTGLGFANLNNLVSGVSHLTKFVESTGTKVISGGLDTLESIGKRTMEVLQEGDPGLKKKRAFLKLDQDKPILSQVLREAKERSDKENGILQEKHMAKKMNYETLFDDHHGLVHLEALEMLSKQCDIKLQTLIDSCTGEAFSEIQETIDQVKELCELPDEDDDEQLTIEDIKNTLETAVKEIGIKINYDKFISTWIETESWLNNSKNTCDEYEVHQEAIATLAQLTACAVEQFHKAGELLLIKEHHSTADEADSLVQMTTALTSLVGIAAAQFSDVLNAKASESPNKEKINGLITNVFYEAANSSSYIQDAFQLLIPVLQVGAV